MFGNKARNSLKNLFALCIGYSWRSKMNKSDVFNYRLMFCAFLACVNSKIIHLNSSTNWFGFGCRINKRHWWYLICFLDLKIFQIGNVCENSSSIIISDNKLLVFFVDEISWIFIGKRLEFDLKKIPYILQITIGFIKKSPF